jgi:hypothetical protein
VACYSLDSFRRRFDTARVVIKANPPKGGDAKPPV